MSPAGRIAISSALMAVVGTSMVSAQSASGILNDLSQGCKTAATGLVGSPIARCLSVNNLVSVVTASGSVVEPINTWVGDLCSQQPCAQADIDSARSALEAGCNSDIADGNIAAVALDTIVANLPTVRDGVCYQASSNSSFCITDFLNNAQKAEGEDLTIQNIEDIFSSADSLKSSISKLPAGDVCTDCNKAIYTKISPILNSTEQSSLSDLANQECGATFTDGNVPSDVQEASADDSSAASRTVVSAGVAVLAVAGVFVLA